MTKVGKIQGQPKKTKTIKDLQIEVAKMVRDEMRELNRKKPLSPPEVQATEALARLLSSEKTLKDLHII